jgi:hypothetical protein
MVCSRWASPSTNFNQEKETEKWQLIRKAAGLALAKFAKSGNALAVVRKK